MDSHWGPIQTPGARRSRGAPRVPSAPRAPGAPGSHNVPGALGAPDAPRAPHAPSAPRGLAAPGAPHARRARSVPSAPVKMTEHIGKCRPPPSLSKTKATWWRGDQYGVWCAHPQSFCAGFEGDCWPAQARQYVGTPPTFVKTQCKVIAGRPRVVQ